MQGELYFDINGCKYEVDANVKEFSHTNKEPKKLAFTSNEITLDLSCFEDEMIEKLSKSIDEMHRYKNLYGVKDSLFSGIDSYYKHEFERMLYDTLSPFTEKQDYYKLVHETRGVSYGTNN